MATDWLTIGIVILSAAFHGVAWVRTRHHAHVAGEHSLAAWTSSIVAGSHAATACEAAEAAGCESRAIRCRARKGCGS